MTAKIRPQHALQWIADLFSDEPTFVQRRMFGCEAIYLNYRLTLVLAADKEPWNGLLVCTAREFHESLRSAHPELAPHAILGKWLYVSQNCPSFEQIAQAIAKKVIAGDARIGVEAKPKKISKTKKPAKTKKKK